MPRPARAKLRSAPARLGTIGRSVGFAPKVADPFYTSPEWQALRARIIRDRGARCEVCGNEGVRIYADHLVELKDGGAPLDPSNVGLKCASCHSTKTAAERTKRHQRAW